MKSYMKKEIAIILLGYFVILAAISSCSHVSGVQSVARMGAEFSE